ncbi:MAG: arginine N-succinyltransferase, partial [Sphingomonadales bacterium]|nr:arginine N-succinyltransferase [Sphingomonadales bacterium]
RYLFIAMHRERFNDRVMAELRGVIDEAGGSAFWDALAGKFFGMSFQEADEFNARKGNQFIADLMPKHPIYLDMLPESARQVIGVPHPSGRAAMRMLEKEGFSFNGYIDIFDGGPTVEARIGEIRTVADSKPGRVGSVDASGGTPSIVAAHELADFRCCYGAVSEAETEAETETVGLDGEAAKTLRVAPGDAIRHVAR